MPIKSTAGTPSNLTTSFSLYFSDGGRDLRRQSVIGMISVGSRVEYSIKPNYRPKRPKINSLPWLIYLYEPNIQHVYSPYHYCNVCKAREPMPTYTAGYRTANLHSHRSFVLQLSPKWTPKMDSVKMAAPCEAITSRGAAC